jgi:hypothetical protein
MDIKDLYVKIPTNTALNIVNKILKHNKIDVYTRKELMIIIRLITNQNYFHYEGKFYKSKSGVAMGSPLSGILAEIYLQQIEQTRIKHLLEDGRIIYYNRYVDDIFLIYDQTKINPQIINIEFNSQYKELHFTINEELNNQINYLDLTLTNNQGHIEMEIYRKPTATDITLNKYSCHPNEHKLAANRSWIHRLLDLTT